ncbi:MAG: hypothetical protein MOB07_06640 [Acidobacteria bacterium]|nr:hypothetical protein [Acidobacteriota bacterium]
MNTNDDELIPRTFYVASEKSDAQAELVRLNAAMARDGLGHYALTGLVKEVSGLACPVEVYIDTETYDVQIERASGAMRLVITPKPAT